MDDRRNALAEEGSTMKVLSRRLFLSLGIGTILLAVGDTTARAQAFGFGYVGPRFGLNVGPVAPGFYGGYYPYRPVVVAPPPVFVPPPVVVARPPVVVAQPFIYGGYRPGFPGYPRYYRR